LASANHDDRIEVPGKRLNRVVEILVLLLVCYLVFFSGLGRYDYINTESLRAVVVDEMLDREGLSMPTVHEAPYLKKPPLYAWTTTLIARAAGEFNEEIARLPSAVCGTLFVLLLYGLGEAWIGCGGGYGRGRTASSSCG
jgi:4-amino-4-deoxy-L-arabinose transferase-like glycosyltransferase